MEVYRPDVVPGELLTHLPKQFNLGSTSLSIQYLSTGNNDNNNNNHHNHHNHHNHNIDMDL